MSSSGPHRPQPNDDDERSRPLSEMLAMALLIHREGRFVEATAIYRRILAAAPDNVDALVFLGLALHQAGNIEQALECLDRALALDPDHVDALSNRGNVHRSLNRLEEAEADYRRALAFQPDDFVIEGSLGTVLRARGDLEGAVALYRRALERSPEHAATWQELASALAGLGRGAEAVEAYREAARLSPASATLCLHDGIALFVEGRFEEAAEMYRRCLALAPDNPRARHLLAATTGEAAPSRASDAYVRAEFDDIAAHFDARLADLEYRGPEIVARSVAEIAERLPTRAVVLDAGCGTGLCAPHLRPVAGRLVGLDLSVGMLEQARKRGGYDELVVGELTAHLRQHLRVYDLVVSADTLVYFGDLTEVIAAAAASLRPGGFLIFTLERAARGEIAGGYRLQPHGRYCHARKHVSRVLGQAGFVEVLIGEISSRKEANRPVPGFLVRGRRSGN